VRFVMPCCNLWPGDVLGPFDLAALPIGAYSPRWFMSSIHCDPFDAVEVHRDIRSRFSVGMHWGNVRPTSVPSGGCGIVMRMLGDVVGTFVLTDEPVLEPPKLLAEALARRELPPDQFITLRHGETITVPFQHDIRTETAAEVVPIDAASGV
jgi:N-acyl-phosphatidylethanolamine-hydrolysing phospholipase D